LKVIDNPHDEPALMRIINQPPRGIGNSAQKRLFEEATSRGKVLWDVLPDAMAIDGIDAKTAAAVAQFRRLIEQFRDEAAKVSLSQLIALVLEKTAYRDALAKLYPDPTEREARLASLEEIINAAANYEKKALGSRLSALGQKSLTRRRKPTADSQQPSLSDFLDDMLLSEREDNDEKDSQLARNAVALMTLHSAKGLEFPRVYLVGMEEGILPHKRSVAAATDAAIDEERRLCYVGVTRAREHLTLSFALARRKWGKLHKTVPSRFLYEMTGQAENFPPRAESSKKTKPRRRPRRAAQR
jgi:DNA helicase-2/ATP-dependent DNA helicase PcrA